MTPEPSPSTAAGFEPAPAAALPLVDLIAAATVAAPGRVSGVVVGECVDDRHPQLPGRVLVRIAGNDGSAQELWVACLVHSPVRRADRVLLLQPGNWPEPVVVGVLDGLRPRAAPTTTAATLDLRRDELVELRDHTGAPLVTIVPSEHGPVLRLARADQRLEIAGKLAIAAETVEFRAAGAMTLAAGGDVVVTGEEIALN